jgi:hypothetical protein
MTGRHMGNFSLLKRNPTVQRSPHTRRTPAPGSSGAARSRAALTCHAGDPQTHHGSPSTASAPRSGTGKLIHLPSPRAAVAHLQVHPDHPLSHALPCRHGCATFADTSRPELPATPTHTPQQPGAQGAASHHPARAATDPALQPARTQARQSLNVANPRGGAEHRPQIPTSRAPIFPTQPGSAAERADGSGSPAAGHWLSTPATCFSDVTGRACFSLLSLFASRSDFLSFDSF